MIKVRKAHASDTLQLERLFLITRQKTFTWEKGDKFKLEDYRKATEGETVFVAENHLHQIVGFISIWDCDSIPFIHHLFVAPDQQRKGIGGLLMHSLFSWLPLPYQLKCIKKNQIACAFYKKSGWIEIDQGSSEEGDYLLLELKKNEISPFCFNFRPVETAHRSLVHAWFAQLHVAEWFYGDGLQNTLKHLDEFLQGTSQSHYWLAYHQEHPFALFMTSSISKPNHWCIEEGEAITLDMLMGDISYLGIGLSPVLIQEFLLSQFSHAAEVLIDPEATNTRAIHVYKKVGFAVIGEFIPLHSPHLHYMMRLSMKKFILTL